MEEGRQNQSQSNYSFQDIVNPANYGEEGHYEGPGAEAYNDSLNQTEQQGQDMWDAHQNYMDTYNGGDVRDQIANGEEPERERELESMDDLAEGDDPSEIQGQGQTESMDDLIDEENSQGEDNNEEEGYGHDQGYSY